VIRLRRRQIIINTKDGNTFKGILWTKGSRLIEMRQSEMLSPQGQALPVDGALIVERANVSYYQVLN
jgi:hypothetical protein